MSNDSLSQFKLSEYVARYSQFETLNDQDVESGLRRALRFVDTLAEASPNPIYILNLITGKYEYFNNAITDMLGYEVDAILQGDIMWAYSRTHPDDIPEMIEKHVAGLAIENNKTPEEIAQGEKTIFEFHYRMRHEITGEWRNLIQRAIIFERTDTGKVLRLLGTMYDVTDILHAEESLKQALKREKTLLEIQLEQKRKELETLTVNLIHRNSMLRDFHTKISDILLMPENDAFKALQNLERSLQTTMSTELEWSQLNTLFQEVHVGFKHNLLAHAPNLTNAEIKVCYLLKLNLTTKEIANLLHMSIRTIEYTRLNIRKKLKITQNLNSFLQNL